MRKLARPHELTARQALEGLASGRFTVRAYAEGLLERIAAREPEVLAWEMLDVQGVLDWADRLDAQGRGDGLLAGIPFGAKDIIDSARLPTCMGSPIYKDNRPRTDAACIALTEQAGGRLMGKTVSTEFANVFPGKTRNPFDVTRTPGGSSSGSAAAVGAGMVPLALGTQTTGSAIRPASYCGIYCYVSSYGAISLSGVRQSSWTLDRLGLFARSVDDLFLYGLVLQGRPACKLEAPSVRDLRVGFCRTHLWDQLEPETKASLEKAASDLSAAGAKVVDAALPANFEKLAHMHRWISSFEFTRNYAYEITHHYDQISDMLREGRITDGLACPWTRYREAVVFADRCRPEFDSIMGDYDVLLTASAAGEAPAGKRTGNYSFYAMWTLLHVPCMTVPAFRGPNGLPVGAQLIGRFGQDDRLLAAGRTIAETLDATIGVD